MSISSINAHKFYDEIVENRKVYTIKDSGGYPAPKNSSGQRCQPFWSSSKIIEKIIQTVPDYKNFEIVEISLDDFKDKLEGLIKDNFLVGVNWSGENVKGYDLPPDFVLKAISARIL